MKLGKLFSSVIVVAFSLIMAACSENTDESRNGVDVEGGSSKNAQTHTLLDTGLVYELPVAVTLYPQKGMDTATSDSLEPLIVIPVGAKFGVFTHALVGKTPWYAIRVFTGPQGGWKDVGGHPLDSLEILTYMAQNQGLPGWISHRDIEGQPMRYIPYPKVDSTKGKVRRK